MAPTLNNFFSQYDKKRIMDFMTNIKSKELVKNPNATPDDIMYSFSINFPIQLLSDYHSWLISNYKLFPKDEQ